MAQQAIGELVRPIDETLRAIDQPTLRCCCSAQPQLELFGAGLQRSGRLREFRPDEPPIARTELQRRGAFAQ